MTKIRKIIEKIFEPYMYEDGACEVFEISEVFDKLEEELQTLMTKAVNRAYKNALKKLKMDVLE